MTPDFSPLSRLFTSKSRKAQLVGFTVFALFWIPDVAKIADNPALTFWQRVEQFSATTGRSLLTLVAIAIPPSAVIDKNEAD